MHYGLDIRTLCFSAAILGMFYAIVLYAFGNLQKEHNSFNLFSVATISLGAGAALIGFRDMLPTFISIVISNILLLFGYVLYFEGTRRFVEKEENIHPLSFFTMIAAFVGLILFTYTVPSFNARIYIISSFESLLTFICGLLLVNRSKLDRWRKVDLITAGFFFFASFLLFFRIIFTIIGGPIEDFINLGSGHASIIIGITLFVSGTTFGYLWMVAKRYENELVKLAALDPLTSTFNRRGLEATIEKELNKMQQTDQSLSAIFFDIDHFKLINDRYGHKAGDTVIAEYAKLIQENLRPDDILGRMGGDEFILILPKTSAEEAFKIAERLRKEAKKHTFIIGQNKITITSSFGVTTTNNSEISVDDLIPKADQALYQSKQTGRNRVTFLSNEFTDHSPKI